MKTYVCVSVLLFLALMVGWGQCDKKSKIKYIPINLENAPPPKKILCYYNHEAYKREGKYYYLFLKVSSTKSLLFFVNYFPLGKSFHREFKLQRSILFILRAQVELC